MTFKSCFGVLLVAVLFLGGCASSGGHPKDPYEDFNRGVYKFNRGLDKAVLKPAAEGYRAVTPDPIEEMVGNFFNNLGEIKNVANNLLQGKLGAAGKDTSRFLINSTLGILGISDPAQEMGLERSEEDFGQTLAVWGVPDGPYLMLPLLGPSTVRDGFGPPVDSFFSPINELDHVPTRNSFIAFSLIHTRSTLLDLEDQLTDSPDEYAFLRDVYFQRREFLINDGEILLEDDECEFEEDCEF